MRDIDTLILARTLRHLRQFIGARIFAGRINQRGAPSESPVLHSQPDKLLHSGNLFGIRLSWRHSFYVLAHRCRTHEGAEVDRRSRSFPALQHGIETVGSIEICIVLAAAEALRP